LLSDDLFRLIAEQLLRRREQFSAENQISLKRISNSLKLFRWLLNGNLDALVCLRVVPVYAIEEHLGKALALEAGNDQELRDSSYVLVGEAALKLLVKSAVGDGAVAFWRSLVKDEVGPLLVRLDEGAGLDEEVKESLERIIHLKALELFIESPNSENLEIAVLTCVSALPLTFHYQVSRGSKLLLFLTLSPELPLSLGVRKLKNRALKMALYHLIRIVKGATSLLLPGDVGQRPEQCRGELNTNFET
jgi:hypothetical protein